jgi:NADH:ubiquinone oxidoreductase subunit E
MADAAATSKQAEASEAGPMDRQELLGILAGHGSSRGGLISVLEGIQARCGYLPEDILRVLSEETGRSLVDIYGIATFYRAFSLVPRGKHLVCVCQGTACHVRGSPRVVEQLERQMGIQAGQTTPDGLFTLETVNCLGACALGPVVVIDGRYFSKVRVSNIRRLLDGARDGFTDSHDHDGAFPIETSCPLCNHSLMDPHTPVDGLPSIRMIVAAGEAVGAYNLSALHGRGVLVCQADIPESEVCNLFCPRCQGLLAGSWTCSTCGAPMAKLAVKGGGMLHLCRRRGCQQQRLDLECVNG